MKGFTDFFNDQSFINWFDAKISNDLFFFVKELCFFINASEMCLMAKLWLYQCKLRANLKWNWRIKSEKKTSLRRIDVKLHIPVSINVSIQNALNAVIALNMFRFHCDVFLSLVSFSHNATRTNLLFSLIIFFFPYLKTLNGFNFILK